MLAKQLAYLAAAESAGIVLGTRVPIALTSRADNARSREASTAIMALVAHARRPASSLAGRPADSVRQLLGHASIRTTADVYGRGNDPAATAGLLDTLDA